jgi:hypothetical protein
MNKCKKIKDSYEAAQKFLPPNSAINSPFNKSNKVKIPSEFAEEMKFLLYCFVSLLFIFFVLYLEKLIYI